MSDENRKDDPGTDPETQRRELIRRSLVAHPAKERSHMQNTRRPRGGGATTPKGAPPPDDKKKSA
ncbi:Hypothetical protein A7982_00450 [Minicystis rosea]|nr:Hypothetical protein A7982_00450 [Minicystis rosea]